MDILSIKPGRLTVDILHPGTQNPIGLKIEVVSLEDERVKGMERQLKNRALRGGRNSVTAEKMESSTLEILMAAIVGWTWVGELTLGGMQNPEFTKENVLRLLKDAPWAAKQIDVALGDDASFFTK